MVMRVDGGVPTPRKYGLYCCIPAVVNSTLASPAGTRLAGSPGEVPAGDEEVSEEVTDVGSVHEGVLGAWMSVWPQRASSDERGGSGLSRSPISSRSFSSERLMRRETCICDIPTRSAI